MPRACRLLAMLGMAFWVDLAVGGEPVDGRSAARWRPQPGWTPTRLATQFSATNQDGWLALAVHGQDKEMTWTFAPAPAEIAGEPRYLVIRYKAEGWDNSSGGYFLMMQDGSPDWRRLMSRRQLTCDGGEHVAAVDLYSWRSPAPVQALVLQIGPSRAPIARLLVRLEFSDVLPPGVAPVAHVWPKVVRTRLEAEAVAWAPSPNWTPRPPAEHGQEKTDQGVRFSMRGAMKSMRWTSRLPATIDYAKTPYVSIRYRAEGDFGPWGYVIYTSVQGKDGKTKSLYAMKPGDVVGDGRWRVFNARVDSKEATAGTLAVGIDALSDRTQIELDYIEFSSQPPEVPIAEMLEFATRSGPWPAGRQGFTPLSLKAPGPTNPLMQRRLGIGSWFETPEITVEGVPFAVSTDPQAVPCTGTVDENSVGVDIPESAREVLLLLAAAFPPAERFGGEGTRDTPLERLDEPERAVVRLTYGDGTTEELIPVRASKGDFALGHDLGLYSVHPAPGKSPRRLELVDRMRNACFALLGATANSGPPRFREPELPQLWYPPVRRPAPAAAEIAFSAAGGITWDAIRSPMLGTAEVRLSGQPVFRLELEGRTVTSADFRSGRVETTDQGRLYVARFDQAGLSLEARLRVRSAGQAAVALELELLNRGTQPLTGTLFFPTAAKLVLSSVSDTWYFCGRRGGIISDVPQQMRDEIGESHPLQVDGFFSPALGAGVAFMPRDLEGVFRWYNVGKDDAGGSYALEFLPQTVPAAQGWKSVPVVVAVTPGDWRDQWQAYLAWVKTWYRPQVPRKEWFRQLFSFVTYGPSWPATTPAAQRTDFLELARQREQRIPGSTDYVHLFGWAITEKFGHWGAYDKYEHLGGKQAFAAAVRRAQDAGKPVGLYLDGYLVDVKSDKPVPDDVERWAIRQPDGKKLFHPSYDAHSLCPYLAPWRKYLVDVFRRVAADVQPSGMYIDEFGRCMTSRICHATDHGHPSPMGMCSGEWQLTREIRAAVPPQIATYCEYVPADVSTQDLDGGYQHVALYNHRDGYRRTAPHFVDLHRFSFPDFKSFELIYYTPLRNGNWFLLKYPFFSGNGYYLTDARLDGVDEHAAAFLTRVFRVQHRYKEAFTSRAVEPLVATHRRGVYANRFAAPHQTVWTLYNANYRTASGRLLSVPHVPGATYRDAWNDRPLEAVVEGDQAHLTLTLGPRAVGCAVQQRPD